MFIRKVWECLAERQAPRGTVKVLLLAATLGLIAAPRAETERPAEVPKHSGDLWEAAALAARIDHLKQNQLIRDAMIVVPLRRFAGEEVPLQKVERAIPDLKAAHVHKVMLTSFIRQTVESFFGRANDHGYWNASFDPHDIDLKLGKWKDLRKLIHDLQKTGVEPVAELVPHHVGYTPADAKGKVRLGRKTYDENDAKIFKTGPEPSRADFEASAQGGPDAMAKNYRGRMWGLPGLNYEGNPEILDFVAHELAKFADLGFQSFRIDAAKHMPLSALVRILEVVGDRVRKLHPGAQPRFILEDITFNYGEQGYKLTQLKRPEGVYYIDFKLQEALNAALLRGGSLQDLANPTRQLEFLGMDAGFLIPQFEDHDGFKKHIFDGSDEARATAYANYLLMAGLSRNRPYGLAGYEQPGDPQVERQRLIKIIDTQSPMGADMKQLNVLLDERFPRFQPLEMKDILESTYDFIVIRRRHEGSEVATYFVTSRASAYNGNPSRIDEAIQRYGLKPLFRWGTYNRYETLMADSAPIPKPVASGSGH
jgi:hypothetical protein